MRYLTAAWAQSSAVGQAISTTAGYALDVVNGCQPRDADISPAVGPARWEKRRLRPLWLITVQLATLYECSLADLGGNPVMNQSKHSQSKEFAYAA
jgi:hypothetical protein